MWLDPIFLGKVLAILSPDPDGMPAEEARMLQELAAMGPGAIPSVVALLSGEIEDIEIAAIDGNVGHRVEPEAVMGRCHVLRASLREFPGAVVVSHLLERARNREDTGAKILVIELLSEVDDRAAFPAILNIIWGIDPIHHKRGSAVSRLQQALERQLAFSEANLLQLESFAKTCDAAVMPSIVRAVGATCSGRALATLTGWIDLDPTLRPIVVEEIARAASARRGALSETTLSKARGLLASVDPDTRGAATRVLGQVRDSGALGQLVDLLEDPAPEVATLARWALERITEKRLGPGGYEDWRVYVERERDWWRSQAPELIRSLDDEDPGEVLKALLPLLSHPTYRHELSGAVAGLLAHSEPGVVRAACSALVRFDSPNALQPLIDGLSGHSKRVRELCGEALCELTGLDLEPEQTAWKLALAD